MRVTRISGPALLLAAAWLVQAVRVLSGVDFSDEMQYYGEILGLQETGRLFAADLFLQQAVYLLFHPFFTIHAALFGTGGLVLTGRILLAALILWMYGMVRRPLVRAGVAPAAASCAALAATFAVPYHNIYAPSYNTVAQVVVAVCFARFVLWRRQGGAPGALFWAAACVVLLLVYPPLGLGIGLIVSARLALERDLRTLGRLLAWGAVMTLGMGFVLLRFSTPADLAAALEFSRSFGVGGLWSRGKELRTLALILALVALGYRAQRARLARPERDRPRGLPGGGALIAALLLALGFASGGVPQEMYWPTFLATTIVALCGCLLALRRTDPGSLPDWRWVTLFFLATGLVLIATSSNGLRQLAGAAMLAAPFYLALASRTGAGGPAPERPLQPALRLFAAGMLAVFATLWLARPYRDAPIWRLSARAPEVPALRYLRLSPEKTRALAMIRSILADVPAGSRVMVVGGHPWIYFATGTLPETPMVYMHHYGPPRPFEILARRIPALRPDHLIVAGEAPAVEEEAVRALIRTEGYVCDTRPLDVAVSRALARQTRHELLPALTVCRSPARAPIGNAPR